MVKRKKYTPFIDGRVKILQKAAVLRAGKILALKRPPDDFSRPNCWDLPGGSVDFGEDLKEAIRAEIKEETGLEVKNLKPVYAVSGVNNKKNIYIVALGWKAETASEAVTLSEEHSQYRWATREEFLELEVGDDDGLLKGIAREV